MFVSCLLNKLEYNIRNSARASEREEVMNKQLSLLQREKMFFTMTGEEKEGQRT